MQINESITTTRQEFKFFVSSKAAFDMMQGLKVLMLMDPYCLDASPYTVSSIYFDSHSDEDLFEKLEGVRFREKYRIRTYGKNPSRAKFEVKRKLEQSIKKISLDISTAEAEELLLGDFKILQQSDEFLYIEKKMLFENYWPRSIVKYERFAFYLPFNNIRVTLDLNIRTQGFVFSDLSEELAPNGVNLLPNDMQVLEIKFENFLPNFVMKFISSFAAQRCSISKYATSRLYNNTEIHGDEPRLPF